MIVRKINTEIKPFFRHGDRILPLQRACYSPTPWLDAARPSVDDASSLGLTLCIRESYVVPLPGHESIQPQQIKIASVDNRHALFFAQNEDH